MRRLFRVISTKLLGNNFRNLQTVLCMSVPKSNLKRKLSETSKRRTPVKRLHTISLTSALTMPDLRSGDNLIQAPVKSPNDNREYRIIHLDNGLRAVLISDLSASLGVEDDVEDSESEGDSEQESDETEDGSDEELDDEQIEDEEDARNKSGDVKHEEKLAAAGLCIGVGSFSDPDDIPGLAHFLEHMVFMGSKKYPTENSFDVFIKRHGGSDNAQTDCERTIFHFDVHSKHFRQALDRFAQFFVCPLLKPDSMGREMEAVDSEFQMSLPSDTYRKQQLFGSLAKSGQPMKKFMWGNLETLKTKPLELKIDLHSRLKEFYHRYYSAQYMTLAVQSRETLNTLESWVREIFSQFPNNNLPAPNFDIFTDPFDTPEFYKLYKIIPVKNIHQVELTWALPSLTQYYRVKPEHYLSWLIGHEGEGSVLSYLKRKIWALSLYCGETEFENNSTFASFSVVVDLTENGLTHVFEVITVIFQYIDMLRRVGPQERIFQEIQTIEQNDFRWQEEMTSADYVQNLCENMQLYPEEDIITGDQLLFDFDSKVISDIQNILVPEKCNISIMSHNFEKEESTKLYEPWFQTPYFVQDVDADWLQKWKNLEVNPQIHLPNVNKFLANNFDIKDPDLPHSDYPVKILDNDQSRLWYKKDNKFKTPKAHIYFHFITPIINNSPQNAVLLDLFVNILVQNLSEAVYPAAVAQLSFTIYGDDTGLSIQVHGFNDKLPILFETILDYVENFTVKDDLFEAVKNHSLKKYYNDFIKPSKLCNDIRLSILQLTHWTSVDKRAAVLEVTTEMLLNFVKKFKSKLFIEGLVQGNITGKEALEMVELVQSKLKCSQIPQNEIPQVRVMQLNAGEKYCRVGGFNVMDGNSVVTNYYQSEPGNIHKSCLLELIITLMEEPCFDILRTQQQLGYNVYCMFRNTFGILGFSVTVHTQADKFSCSQVDERIESFLQDFLAKLETEVTEKEFQTQVTSLIRLKRCVDLHLKEEVTRHWGEITSSNYLFDRINLEIEHLNKISLTELQNWFKDQFGKGEKLRKLGVQVVGAGQIQESKNQHLRRRRLSQRSLGHCSEKPLRAFSKKDLDNVHTRSQNSFDSETSVQSDDEEYKLHFAPHVEDDSLFIDDIHGFKNGLMTFPVTKINN